MHREQNIELTQGDTLIVAVPVEDADTSAEYVDPATADAITYHITTGFGEGDVLVELTDADSEVSVAEAQNVINGQAEKPLDLDEVPDAQHVVRVLLEQSATKDLPVDLLYHECKLEGIRTSTSTVMRGTVNVTGSTT